MRNHTFNRFAAVVAVTVGVAGAAGSAASAEVPFAFEPGAQTFVQSGPGANVAGGHPDVSIDFRLVTDPAVGMGRTPQAPRTATVELPPGLVGDPKAADICPMDDVIAGELGATAGRCPRRAAVGTVAIDATYVNGFPISFQLRRLYRVAPGPNEVAAFGTSILRTPVRIAVTVSPSGGYRVRGTADSLTQAAFVRGFTVDLWGVPADRQGLGTECDAYVFGGNTFCMDFLPADDPNGNPALRYGGPLAGEPRQPFLTNPSVCGGELVAGLRMVPYGTVFSPISTTMSAGTVSGCENQPFGASLDVTPATKAAGQPSGYTVGIDVPQNQGADGVSTAHVKDVQVTLPEGVAISPPSANGLDACSDAQLDLHGDSDPACPDASKIGTLTVESPVLDEPLAGSAFVGTQLSKDPASGEMYRLFLVVKGPGVLVKLKGSIKVNPGTGQVTATFQNNPQLPFSRIELQLDEGQRASLANPTACGSQTTTALMTGWNGAEADITSSFDVSADGRGAPCPSRGFSPGFSAGTTDPSGGESSTFALTVAREDQSKELKAIKSVRLPEGLLGKVASVPLCGEAQASAGTCSEDSRIGHVQVAAGAGAAPLWIPQPGKDPTGVYLTGPYGGAPYGLSVKVPAQAGPFDLGVVVVRSALRVNPRTAAITADTDDMPTIFGGIPLRVKEVRLIMDRPGFVLNPTSCAQKSIGATLVSVDGDVHEPSSRFRAADCAILGFKPRLAMRLTGKGRTRTGAHPGLKTVLKQGDGQANIAKAQVALPKSVVLDPSNSTDPALVCDYDKGLAADCPASSVIGKATARTPLLGKPLAGNVHLVQGIRFGPSGNRIRTTPSLLVKLRGEIAIDLRGRTTVRNNRLVTVFDQVPDARVSSFDLKINGGKKGILVITRTREAKINLCTAGRQQANVRTNGQNGKQANFATTVKTPCSKKAKTGKKNKK